VSRRYAASNDNHGTLGAYLRDIGKLPRLTSAEERELGQRIQHCQDQAACTRLVESNLRFVVSFAKRYRGLGVAFLDLIHAGNIGLIEAARRFDPSRNVKFITYAVWWIRQAMMHALSDESRAFCFPPKLLPLFGNGADDVSLSDPMSLQGSRALGETWPREGGVDAEMIHRSDLDVLAAALGELDRREREVVRLRFGLSDDEPRTLQEIGDRMRLSRERVRQIELQAKDKLRRSARLRSHLN
jgi:RNA polymerase primary sigma factor